MKSNTNSLNVQPILLYYPGTVSANNLTLYPDIQGQERLEMVENDKKRLFLPFLGISHIYLYSMEKLIDVYNC